MRWPVILLFLVGISLLTAARAAEMCRSTHLCLTFYAPLVGLLLIAVDVLLVILIGALDLLDR